MPRQDRQSDEGLSSRQQDGWYHGLNISAVNTVFEALAEFFTAGGRPDLLGTALAGVISHLTGENQPKPINLEALVMQYAGDESIGPSPTAIAQKLIDKGYAGGRSKGALVKYITRLEGFQMVKARIQALGLERRHRGGWSQDDDGNPTLDGFSED